MNKFERCYNCIHRAPCGAKGGLTQDGAICNHFKDKALFVELPCKVGDKVYYAHKLFTEKEFVVTGYEIYSNGENTYRACCEMNGKIVPLEFGDENIGKTVFLIKEDSQKKDQEAPNDHNSLN